MHEEGTNFRGVGARVEQRIRSVGPLVAAEKSFAFAPSAAADCNYFGDLTFISTLASAMKYVSSAMSWESTPNIFLARLRFVGSE